MNIAIWIWSANDGHYRYGPGDGPAFRIETLPEMTLIQHYSLWGCISHTGYGQLGLWGGIT